MNQGCSAALTRRLEAVIEKGRGIAAHLLQAELDQIEFSDGRFAVPGSERSIGLMAVAEAARDPANLPEEWHPVSTAMSSTASTW